MDSQISQLYQQRIQSLTNTLNRLQRQRAWLGWLRLGLLIFAITTLVLLWKHSAWIAIISGVALIAAFLRVVVVDLKLQHLIRHQQSLIAINQQEILIDRHQFAEGENGSSFAVPHHQYSNDLDLLGPLSVFHWLHRTTSHQGHEKLAAWLLHPALPETVKARQGAVKELAPQLAWRQDLQALGMASPLTQSTAKKLEQWADRKDPFFDNTAWQIIRWSVPFVAVAILAGYIVGFVPDSLFYIALLVLFIFSGWISKKVKPAYDLLNKISPETEALSQCIAHIEKPSWKSEWLLQQRQLLVKNGLGSQAQIKQLSQILNRFDYRYNPLVFIPLNVFLLWDLQQMLALKKWKVQNARRIGEWLEAFANMEAISSLANLHYNEPNWAIPNLNKEQGAFDSRELGHPLIPQEKRVCSNFSTHGPGQVSLITGSNMAGKSTFLRSVGLAIVLAHAGAPVCAKSLTLGYGQLMSSMRIADNLEEQTSTFYAELKMLKRIIEAVNKKEPVFLLIDEMLRGTNSHDRQTGSKALILQLLKQEAVGLIATHDLSLSDLEQKYPQQISNYHFDVQVQGEELFFDYKLKNGVCTSLNASLLMKKIGIEL